MHRTIAFVVFVLVSGHLFAQAALQPAQTAPPTLEEVRKGMAHPLQGGRPRATGCDRLRLQAGPDGEGVGAFGHGCRPPRG